MPWWSDWCIYHCTLHSWDGRHAPALALWCDLFADCTEAEMRAASQAVLLKGGVYPSDHPAELRKAIDAARHRVLAPPVRPAGVAECKLCGNTGLVCGLPSLRGVHRGEWTQRTADGIPCRTTAVACRCPLGRWVQECSRNRGRRRKNPQTGIEEPMVIMDLGEYECANPDWQFHLEQQRLRDAAQVKASEATRPMDAAFRAVLARAKGGRTK